MSAANSLCLACSSSLPPSRPGSSKGKDSQGRIFITTCCTRPICPTCLASNPRLARYNPCLQCLAGVAIVTARSAAYDPLSLSAGERVNVDGGVHDEDVFALGDDDSDDDGDREGETDGSLEGHRKEDETPSIPPPPYDDSIPDHEQHPDYSIQPTHEPLSSPNKPDLPPPPSNPTTAPTKYYIKPGDTLLGISLRFKIDGRVLCRLNNLPQSTLRTTPHLLHTRTVLTLPPGLSSTQTESTHQAEQQVAATGGANSDANVAREREYEYRRTRERVTKRLQTITKEADWRVAKTYVALASDSAFHEDQSSGMKDKQPKLLRLHRETLDGSGNEGGRRGEGIEAAAIDSYLEDEEWERREREQGRGVYIPRFPLFEANGRGGESGEGKYGAVGDNSKKPALAGASSKLWSGWKWS